MSNEMTDADAEPLVPGELLVEVVRALVDYPAEVRIEEQGRDTAMSLFLIHVAADDRGKIIGRQGRTIESLRTLFGAILAVDRRRVAIEVANSRRVEDESELASASASMTAQRSVSRRADRRRSALVAA